MVRAAWVRVILACALCAAASAAAAEEPDQPLFDHDDGLLAVTLEAPFHELFAHRESDDYWVSGRLSYAAEPSAATVLDVQVSVRGNSSRQLRECTFPKLKLKFSDGAARNRTVFRGLTGLKVGTHCGEREDRELTSRFGRLANEQSPRREVAVYRLVAAVGTPTLRVRPARIRYVYTDGQQSGAESDPTTLERNAFFLEDNADARRRLGGDEDLAGFKDARADLTPDAALDVAFAEAMIGNFDWCLRFSSKDPALCSNRLPIYNVLAFHRPDDRPIAMMYDFDLSGMVTGHHLWFDDVLDEHFSPSGSQAEVEVLSGVQRPRSYFTRAELDAARQRFVSRKAAVYDVARRADVDAAGRENMIRYLDAFFGAIENDRAFYRPVVVRPTRAFVDRSSSKPLCTEVSPVPVGTLVNPLEPGDAMAEVRLLDVSRRWIRRCPRARAQPVWIDSTAIDTNYPDH